jgi:nitric oxide synthase oxygenase domain/subunit
MIKVMFPAIIKMEANINHLDNSFINQKIIKIIEIYTPNSPHTSQEIRSLGKEESSYTSLEDDPLFLTAAIIDLSPQSKLIN